MHRSWGLCDEEGVARTRKVTHNHLRGGSPPGDEFSARFSLSSGTLPPAHVSPVTQEKTVQGPGTEAESGGPSRTRPGRHLSVQMPDPFVAGSRTPGPSRWSPGCWLTCPVPRAGTCPDKRISERGTSRQGKPRGGGGEGLQWGGFCPEGDGGHPNQDRVCASRWQRKRGQKRGRETGETVGEAGGTAGSGETQRDLLRPAWSPCAHRP